MAGVLAAVVVLMLGVFFAVSSGGGQPSRTVPGVVDQDVAAATATLKRAGFVVQTVPRVADGTPPGVVLEQDPAGGVSLKKGAAVRLSVSAVAGKPAVPSVVNRSRADAIATIEGAGLVASVVEQASGSIAAGIVIAQNPEATTVVASGSTVTITISTGAATATTAVGSVTTRGPTTTVGIGVPPPPVPTTLKLFPTANLVRNPGAEESSASQPFSVGEAPVGWQRGAFQVVAATYGAHNACANGGIPSVAQLRGSGRQLFSSGYDAGAGCGLAQGSIPTLLQDVPLTAYSGHLNSLGWEASALLASSAGSGDGAALTIDILDATGHGLASATTGVVTNAPSDSAFQKKVLRGTLPPGAASVRLTLSFPVGAAYNGGFADDVSLQLG